MKNIGIMQGRLVPPTENRFQCFPRDRWQDEFALAASAKLDCIEWIYDLFGADVNPIATDAGVEAMKTLAKTHGIKVLSLCADYFMDFPLVRVSESELDKRLSSLEWLMHRCALVDINRIVLPFVDASAITNDDELESVIKTLTRATKFSEKTGIEMHLETSLNPERFRLLLSRLPHPMIKVNYDSGNSSSLGYAPRDEFNAYGSRIGSIHIKDRILGGSTVPLGTGDADFVALAECIKKVKYEGDIILQAARGVNQDEANLARHNRDFVLNHVLG
jgi:L-ribulose-5-phosphate 3-epimerase